MDFVEATTLLNGGPTLGGLADALGVSAVSLSRSRTARPNRFYRPPPEGWEAAVAQLAREQADVLNDLAAQLSGTKRRLRGGRGKRSGRRRR